MGLLIVKLRPQIRYIDCAVRAVTKVMKYFKLLGRAMAKALQDNRLLDIPLSYVFYRYALLFSTLKAGGLLSYADDSADRIGGKVVM